MRVLAGIVAGALLLGLASPAFADDTKAPATVQELDKRLAAALKAANVPGAQVALIENGQITFVKAYGYADVAKKIPVTDDTVFRAGSISKSFTAIAIMTAVESHELSLDGKLAALAPDVKFVNPWEKTDPVRLVNLLEHTTGWPDISLRILNINEKDWSVLRGVQESSPEFVSRWKPGNFMVYNNAGPAVAAVILEKASGQSFEDYMNAHVLRPMGMASADFDLPPALAARIAKSYAPDGSITPYQYIILKPAGSLNTNARELAQLVRLMLGRGMVDGHQVLTPASVARIERSESNLGARDGFTLGYGLGNAPFPEPGVAFRGHNGQIDAFTAVEGYNTRCNCGYVLMANGDGADFGTPLSALVEGYLTRAMKMAPAPTVALPDAALEKYDGLYRAITPPNRLLRPFVEVLNLTHVKADRGKLKLFGLGGTSEYLPVSPHLFRRPDREAAGLAFVEDGGHFYKISAFNAEEKEPWWRAILIVTVLLLFVLGAIVTLVMAPVWIVLALMGRLRERGGLAMRLLPLASIATLLVTFGLTLTLVQGSGTSAIAALAGPTPYSLTILVCSILFPLFAAWGLWAGLRPGAAGWFPRAYLTTTSAALLALSIYAASIGWVGVRIWTM